MLTGFQLKAARGALKIPITKLAITIAINRMTLIKLEKTLDDQLIKCHTDTLFALENFFKTNSILFLDRNSVSLNIDRSIFRSRKKLTVFQLRASRAVVNMSLNELSNTTGIKINTLFAYEQSSITDWIAIDDSNHKKLEDFYKSKMIFYPEDFTICLNK